jgi:hypothetical protein
MFFPLGNAVEERKIINNAPQVLLITKNFFKNRFKLVLIPFLGYHH